MKNKPMNALERKGCQMNAINTNQPLKAEQYLALSSLVYFEGIRQYEGETISAIQNKVSSKEINFSALELKSLSSLASWHLINATTCKISRITQ